MHIVVDWEHSYPWRVGACVLLTTHSIRVGGAMCVGGVGGAGGAYVSLASWSRCATKEICC